MQIKSFSVKNFKNFQNQITFDFSKTRDYGFNTSLVKNGLVNKSLIYGYNGSGKSNLGFAMMDITNHLSDNIHDFSHYNNYLNANSVDDYAEFTYVFLDNGQKEITYSYKKDVNMRLQSEEVQVDGKLFFQFNYKTGKYINDFIEAKDIVFSNKNSEISALKFMRNNLRNLPKDSPIEEIVDFADDMLWFRSVRSNECMGKVVSGELISDFIINNGLVSDFESFLRKCDLDYKLSTATVPGGNIIIVCYKKPIEFFSQASTGTASLALLYYWKKKCQKDLKFLFIDEFDAFYHYCLSKFILSFLNEDPSFQLVLTTHNSYLADNTFMRPDCYFLLKNEQIKSFADSTNKTIREGHSLENMLLGGSFE
jgi:AAA15 family ATPase/GTPase